MHKQPVVCPHPTTLFSYELTRLDKKSEKEEDIESRPICRVTDRSRGQRVDRVCDASCGIRWSRSSWDQAFCKMVDIRIMPRSRRVVIRCEDVERMRRPKRKKRKKSHLPRVAGTARTSTGRTITSIVDGLGSVSLRTPDNDGNVEK